MRLGKLHIGWRAVTKEEALAFGFPLRLSAQGFFVEWGDDQNGFGVCVKIKPTP